MSADSVSYLGCMVEPPTFGTDERQLRPGNTDGAPDKTSRARQRSRHGLAIADHNRPQVAEGRLGNYSIWPPIIWPRWKLSRPVIDIDALRVGE